MAEIDTVIGAVCDALCEYGVPAVMTAYPSSARERFTSPVATVGLGGGSGVSSGFSEYMGIRFDEVKQTYAEVYGKRLELTLSVGIWSPKDAEYGAAACHAIFGDLVAALPALPNGIRVRELTCGETRFDRSAGMFRLGAELKLTAFLYAEKTDDAEILDFTLRGTVN